MRESGIILIKVCTLFFCVSEPMQDMLKAFGFNSLQLYDIWQRYFDVGWHIPPEEWCSWPEEWSKKADTAGR